MEHDPRSSLDSRDTAFAPIRSLCHLQHHPRGYLERVSLEGIPASDCAVSGRVAGGTFLLESDLFVSYPALISAKLAMTAQKKAKRTEKARRLKTRKPTLSSLKKKLWSIIAPQIRERYGPRCYTCGGNGTQTGHMFPKGRAHAISAFMPANLKPQCFYCNVNLGGNGAEFAARYLAREGKDKFSMVAQSSSIAHKWTAPEVEMFIEKAKLGLDHYEGFYMSYFGLE